MLTTQVHRRSFIGIASAAVLPTDALVRLPRAVGEPERTVLAFLNAAYRDANADAALALLADDCVFEDPTFHLKEVGRDAIGRMLADAYATFRSIGLELERTIAADPWVVTQQALSATLRAGDKKMLRVRGASIFELRRGRIVRWFDYYDYASYKAQGGP